MNETDSIKKKYKYKPEYCDLVIQHFKEGGSKSSLAATLLVCRDTIHRWINQIEEFADAVKIAEASYQKRLEKLAFAKISGQDLKGFDPKKSDTLMLIFMMKTRLYKDYGEKVKHEHEGKGSVVINYEMQD